MTAEETCNVHTRWSCLTQCCTHSFTAVREYVYSLPGFDDIALLRGDLQTKAVTKDTVTKVNPSCQHIHWHHIVRIVY